MKNQENGTPSLASRMQRRDFLHAAGIGAAALMSRGWSGLAQGGPTALVIRGGTVVNADRRVRADIRVRADKIEEVAASISGAAGDRVIDARGLMIFPGGIDPHVHLPGGADDLTSGTAAAVSGGITTVGDMTFPAAGESLLDAVRRVSGLISQQAIADVMLHPGVREISDSTLEDLAKLFAAGHTSVKIIMSGAAFDRQAREFLRVIRAAGKSGALSLIHCEDYSILTDATDSLMAEGKTSARYLAESRPVNSEVVAVQRAMGMCEETGSPVYVVHLSSERALRVCQEARSRGLRVYVETRPTYLFLTRERYSDPEPGLYVSWPPLREASDVEAIWRGLKEGAIQTLGSDHSASPRSEKLDPALTLKNFRPGFSDLELMLPMFYSDGVITGKIPPERFAAVTAANAARLFGLYPTKGVIAAGSDADLVLWDPARKRVVHKADLPSRADFTVYEGREVTGWPRMTIRRGEVVFESGKVLGKPGSGRLLQRGPSQALPVGGKEVGGIK